MDVLVTGGLVLGVGGADFPGVVGFSPGDVFSSGAFVTIGGGRGDVGSGGR